MCFQKFVHLASVVGRKYGALSFFLSSVSVFEGGGLDRFARLNVFILLRGDDARRIVLRAD
jgi:hypothetical protein